MVIAMTSSRLDPLRTFGFRLWHVKHAWTRRMEAALAPLGLTHMQFVLLRATSYITDLGERPSQSHLASALATDRMTVSKVLRTLEAKGLISRRTHPDDPRAHLVELTEAGEDSVSQAVPLVLKAQDAFFGQLGPARMEQLGALLDALLAIDGNPMFPSRGPERSA